MILSRVYNEQIRRPAPSSLISLIGRRLRRYRRGQRFESRASLFFFSDLLFATAKAAYITAIIFIHIIQIIIVNTQALWFHDMFYGQNRLLLAHAFNILSAAICFFIILTCTLLDCFISPIVKLENLTVRFPFWRNPNLLNSIVCLTSS